MKEENKKKMIVLGMHRSGTSLLANWAHELGIHMGDQLLEEDFANRNGHYEDLDFLDLHKKLLSENGVVKSGLTYKINLKLLNENSSSLINDLVKKKSINQTQWGWKDPRTCLFLKTYEKIIQEGFFIVIFRPRDEVVNSLIKRDLKRLYYKYARFNKYLKAILKPKIKLETELILRRKKKYERTWNLYNSSIKEFIETNQNFKILTLTTKTILEYDRELLLELRRFGFELLDVRFHEIYDQKLITSLSNSNPKDEMQAFFHSQIEKTKKYLDSYSENI